MIKDFVPARTSPSTGIVIQSHILERNKYPRHEPTFVQYSGSVQIKMVTVSGSDGGAVQGNTYYVEAIPVQYQSNSIYLGNSSGTIYMSSSTNIQKYTGEFSGSTIKTDVNTFTNYEISSYLYPWTSSVAPSQHGGQSIMFLTYSVSPTLNNITGSVVSQKFYDLDYNNTQLTPTNYGLITQSMARTEVIGAPSQSLQPYSQYAQLQDYNYYLPSTVSIRYSGSYLQGKTYNTWSVGDISYANDPVINYYSNKLGFFTQIQSSSFIPGAVNATLGYLADVSGGLFELNQNNTHWVDVQNIFVEGTNLTVKQFDNKKYSNQVATDGVKTIYNSGYNYTPELYFSTSSDAKVYFQYNGGTPGETLKVYNQANFLISGSGTPRYLATNVVTSLAGTSSGYVYNIFDQVSADTNGYYTVGNAAGYLFPTYSVPTAGTRAFNVTLNANVQFPVSAQEVTYSFTIKNNNSTVIASTTKQFKSSQTAGYTQNGNVNINPSVTITSPVLVGGPYVYYGPFSVTGSNGSPIGVTANDSWISASLYSFNGGGGYLAMNIPDTAGAYYDTNGYLSSISAYTPGGSSTYSTLTSLYNAQAIPPTNNLTANLDLSLATNQISYNAGDKVTFQLFQQVTASNSNFTSSVTAGLLTVNEGAAQGSYPYAATSSGNFIESLRNSGSYGEITLTGSLASFYGYQQIPYFVSGGVTYSSSLYSQYGDINTTFSPQPYDKIILKDINGLTQNFDIYSSSFNNASSVVSGSFSSGSFTMFTVPNITANWVASPSLVQTFLLLRRYNDEQNVILTFNKPPGATSYGFIIPETISPQVINNINTLQANVQAQLLSTQASTGLNVATQ